MKQIDVDQDTYVAAEAAPNSDDDQLRFVTAGSERMRITADGRRYTGCAQRYLAQRQGPVHLAQGARTASGGWARRPFINHR